jgi:hypothetical protein
MKLEPPSPIDSHSVAEEGVIALDSSDVSEFPGIVDRPPIEMKTWRSPVRGTRLVFIVRNIPREPIERTPTSSRTSAVNQSVGRRREQCSIEQTFAIAGEKP